MTAWTGPYAPTLLAFEEATQAFVDLVGRVRGDWDRPGLGVWDLRSLVGHTARALVTVTTYLDRPSAAEDLGSPAAYLVGSSAVDPELVAERGRQAGVDLGADPAGWVAQAAERAVDRVRAADPEALIETVNGGMRVGAYLPTR
ncbi:MAG: maleylpyruvate isomerase N-terminal domain-containing protein, partial [Janthinobacterium lividum]